MNRTILKPLELRKRFIAVLAALFAVFIIAGLFAACGNDDNVTGGNPPPSGDSLIFTLDSFAIRSSNPGALTGSLYDTAQVNFDSLKITFEMENNLPNDSTLIGVFMYDVGTYFIEIPKPHNSAYTLYWKQRNNFNLVFMLYLRFVNPDNNARYLKVKNFKIYKLKLN